MRFSTKFTWEVIIKKPLLYNNVLITYNILKINY